MKTNGKKSYGKTAGLKKKTKFGYSLLRKPNFRTKNYFEKSQGGPFGDIKRFFSGKKGHEAKVTKNKKLLL